MNKLLTAICFICLTCFGVANEPASSIKTDYFSLSISDGESEGKVITATPKNKLLRERLDGGRYFLELRIASTAQFARKKLWLKTDKISIPLDVELPPPLEVTLYTADFEYVRVRVYDSQCFPPENSIVHYFSVSDKGFTWVDPSKEGLIESAKPAEQDDDAN